MTDVGNIKISHCIYNGMDILERHTAKYIPICLKLQRTIETEFKKRKYETIEDFVEFTYGIDPDTHIEAIAIVSKKDNFNRKIGTKIVVGRIKRMRGDLKREPYLYNPFVCQLKEVKHEQI